MILLIKKVKKVQSKKKWKVIQKKNEKGKTNVREKWGSGRKNFFFNYLAKN